MPRPEQRFRVDFQVFLSWQDRRGTRREAPARCVDLSASGARVEARDQYEVRTQVQITSEQFGRMGTATVRYSRREGMKFIIGLQFNAAFGLSDPARKAILTRVLRPTAASDPVPLPEAAPAENPPS